MAFPNDYYEVWCPYSGAGKKLYMTLSDQTAAIAMAVSFDAPPEEVDIAEVWHLAWGGVTLLGQQVVLLSRTKIHP